MSVVGLTLGNAAKAIATGDRQRRQRGDQGDDLRRRPRALVPGEAGRAGRRRGRGSWPAPSSPRALPASSRGALLGRDRPRAGRGRGRPRWRSTSRRRGSRRRRRRRSRRRRRAARRARRRRRRTRRRGWRRSPPRRARRGPRSAPTSRPCGPGPSPGSARRGRRARAAARPSMRPARAIASASRWRSPPERSRGSASSGVLEPDQRAARPGRPRPAARPRPARGPGSRRGSGSAARSRPGPRPCHAPARSARRRCAAGCSSRPRFAPSARPARPARTAGRSPAARLALHPPRPTRPTDPSPSVRRLGGHGASANVFRASAPRRRSLPFFPRECESRGSGAPRRRGPRRRGSAARAGRRREAARSRPARTSERTASPAPGRRSIAQARKSPGAPSKAIGAGVHRDHPVGGGQAALETVLGEQHRHPPLLVEPAQQPDQLVAGDRVELRGRLVEQDQRRPGDQGRGQGDPLQLPAREGVDGPLEQVRDRQREGDLLDRARARRGGSPRSSSGSSISAATVVETTWASGSWAT